MAKKTTQNMRIIHIDPDRSSALIIGRNNQKLRLKSVPESGCFISSETGEKYRIKQNQVEYLGHKGK